MSLPHKIKSDGLICELGLSASDRHVVLAHGTLPVGAYNDLAIFETRSQATLYIEERIVAEREYKVNG